MENVVNISIVCSPDSHTGRLSCILRHSEEKEKVNNTSGVKTSPTSGVKGEIGVQDAINHTL